MTALSRQSYAPRHDIVLHWPFAYDLLLKLFWGRAERRYRARVLDLAELAAGDSVLDAGCGTGTLAIAAAARVGSSGQVVGIDPSPEMIARARKKSIKVGGSMRFQLGSVEHLPFADETFDVVLNTTVLHCVSDPEKSIAEMSRILRPNGSLVVVDFGGSPAERSSLIGKMHVHRNFDLRAFERVFDRFGVHCVAAGPLGLSDLHYVLARKD